MRDGRVTLIIKMKGPAGEVRINAECSVTAEDFVTFGDKARELEAFLTRPRAMRPREPKGKKK